MLLDVKDGVLEKVEGDPQQSITKGALPIRMLSLPEYVYSPCRIAAPAEARPRSGAATTRHGNSARGTKRTTSSWRTCAAAPRAVRVELHRHVRGHGARGRQLGPHHVVPRVQQPQRRVHAVRLVVLRSRAWPAPPTCWARRIPGHDYASQYPTSYDDPRSAAPRSHPDLGQGASGRTPTGSGAIPSWTCTPWAPSSSSSTRA